MAFRGIDPFIVTLGMLALARGLVYAYTEGAPLTPADPAFGLAGSSTILGFPVIGLFWIGVIVLVTLTLHRTVFGRRVYAVGSNPQAAYSSGVPVPATLLAVYVMAGTLAGLGGFLLTSFFQSAFKGALILLAVFLATVGRRRSVAGH